MKISSLYKNDLSKLFESYGMLIEGVQSIRPQYQMISDNDFNSLLELDPTYSGGDNLGKYTKWILNLYKKFVKDRKEEEKYKKNLEYKKSHPDAIVNEPVYQSQDRIEDFQKIRDLLSDYEKYKKDIKQDVSSFNSIAELASVVRSAQNKDISVDERAKENYKIFRDAISDGLNVVYNGPNFIIGVPTTYEASSHFKKPVTEWCTAYPDMYESYLDEYGGKYYIHLNKHTGELNQAHYESDQFKDASDNEIDKDEFISKYPELKSFYDKIWDMNTFEWWVLHNRQPTEKEQINALYKNPSAIKYIKNPSEEVQLNAVINNPFAIRYIDNPSNLIQRTAIDNDINAFEYIKNPSEEIEKIYMVSIDPSSIAEIENPNEEVQLAAVRQDGDAIQYIKNPTDYVKFVAIKEDPWSIRYIDNPSNELKLEAVKKNGRVLQYIDHPTEEMKLEAVKNNCFALDYINNPTEEMKLEAVKQNGIIISKIVNPTEEMKLEAVKSNSSAIKEIDNPTEEMMLIAINEDSNMIRYIKNPTEEMQEIAVRKNPFSIEYIVNPSEKIQMLAVKKFPRSLERIKNPTENVKKVANELLKK